MGSSSIDSELLKGVKYLVDTRRNMVKIPPEFILPPEQRPSSPTPRIPIPIIDLHLLDGPPKCRAKVVEDIAAACADSGFFQVVNHGVEERLMNEMLEEIKAFFELPWEEKAVFSSTDVMSPVRFGTSLSSPHPQVIRYWRDFLRQRVNASHLWPDSPPNYKKVGKDFSGEMLKLALRLAGAVSESLGLETGYIEKSLGEGCHIVAASYYPPCPQPELTLGLAGHSDNNCLVILTDNGVEGLQIKHKDDSWVSVPPIMGSFVVNVGDYLEILSNGKYKSVEHRVVVDQDRLRMSFGLGLSPELSATMAPAPPLVGEGRANFKAMNYGEYVKQQQERTVRGKSALDVVKM